MKSLQETILSIQNKYIQGLIELNDYDFSTRQNIISKQPTFLFRGERTKWKETKSTASRKNLLVSPTFDEINYWISGLHKISGQTLNNYSLYMFLRTVLNTDNVELIGGLLQHYEFDTSFIDLTSDINVAAYFLHQPKETSETLVKY